MDYLFTHGTRNEPRKQTELGKIPESWDVTPVGSICKCIVPSRDKPKKFDGNIPWITTPDLKGKVIVFESLSGLNLSNQAIQEVKARIVPSGSVIMTCVGEFGITAIAGCDIVINQQLHAFICPKNLDSYFLIHALRLQTSYMKAIALVTTVPYMSKDKCNSIPIPLPTLQEQQEIADILSSCDAKIATLEREIKLHDELFRAMLEELMTGQLSSLPSA